MSLKLSGVVWEHAPFQQTTLLVLLALADHASDDGSCWPAVQRIAARARTTERHVRRILTELEDAGWVQRTERAGTSTVYRLTPDTQVTPDAQVTPDVEVTPTPDAQVSPPLTPASATPDAQVSQTVTNHQENRQENRQALVAPDRFLEFWQAYPRKAGKDAARRAYTKAVARASVDDVIDGARRFAEDPNLPAERQYIPHPATWLNAGRWDDEPLPDRGRPGHQVSTGSSRALSTLELARRYAEQEAQEGAHRAAIADRPAAG